MPCKKSIREGKFHGTFIEYNIRVYLYMYVYRDGCARERKRGSLDVCLCIHAYEWRKYLTRSSSAHLFASRTIEYIVQSSLWYFYQFFFLFLYTYGKVKIIFHNRVYTRVNILIGKKFNISVAAAAARGNCGGANARAGVGSVYLLHTLFNFTTSRFNSAGGFSTISQPSPPSL